MSFLKSNAVTNGKPALSRSATSANSQQYGYTESANSETTKNPTDEFRRVTMLLPLLAVINRQARQVAAVESPDWMITSLERNLPSNRLALNALTILLVRGHEAIAVATADHDISSNSGSGVLPAGSSLHVLTMQEPAPIAEAEHARADTPRLGTTVPDSEWPWSSHDLPRIWNTNPDAHYMVLPRGTSAWEAVSKAAWSQM
jgi:hypothetical protein